MGLAQAIADSAPDTGGFCGIGAWRSSLAPADQAAFDQLITDARSGRDGWNMQLAWEVCAKEGLGLKADRLRAHARGVCACGPR